MRVLKVLLSVMYLFIGVYCPYHFNTILLMLMLIMLSSAELVTLLPSQVADS